MCTAGKAVVREGVAESVGVVGMVLVGFDSDDDIGRGRSIGAAG